VAARLRDHGHDATHVADHNLVLASDEAERRYGDCWWIRRGGRIMLKCI
jgi:hypothetical protein